MDSIARAQNAFAQLEHAVSEARGLDEPFKLGLLIWQIGAGLVGLVEALASAALTLSVPNSFLIWVLPFASGVLLLVSVFSRHRKLPGIVSTLGTAVCVAAVVFVFSLFGH